MNKIIEILQVKDYTIKVKFDDTSIKMINLRPFLKNGLAKELLDKRKFAEVKIDPFGGLYWENGFDICPNFLKDYEPEEKSIEV